MNPMIDDAFHGVLRRATDATAACASSTDAERAVWLEAVADALDDAAAELVALADTESHLGETRLTGELARTTAQLRLFARVALDGAYLEAVIDHADPAAVPPHGDLRRLLVPIGPVAVFAASNFPFAFSVAGGDTASALAVGCPVVVKAHEGHPRLSIRTAELVGSALTAAGAPEGTFGMVIGREHGLPLVEHPAVAAVSFTWSVAGGRALFDAASRRPVPVPFYGELGSLNPVVITRGAVEAGRDELAAGLAGSFTLGAGQFCTKPGVVFVPQGSGFEEALAARVEVDSSSPLLTDGIRAAFGTGLSSLAAVPGVRVLIGAAEQGISGGASPVVLITSAADLKTNADSLLEECFGPVTVLVEYEGEEQLFAAIDGLPGTLTATMHAHGSDGALRMRLSSRLATTAGRVLYGGWPTGVAVTWSQHHGGPYPSTTSVHTSVGATAVRRFQRPIAFQTMPEELLPEALREGNPLGIPRRVDGHLVEGRRNIS